METASLFFSKLTLYTLVLKILLVFLVVAVVFLFFVFFCLFVFVFVFYPVLRSCIEIGRYFSVKSWTC